MSTVELQQLKMAWLDAKERGDTQTQLLLLRDHPEHELALIDFIAAYHASNSITIEQEDVLLSQMTQRALRTALNRVFPATVKAANLVELRKLRGFDKAGVAKALHLSLGVWQKFENGAIQLSSLNQRQLEHLAQVFQVSIEQFSALLTSSQPSMAPTLYRRTKQAARSGQQAKQERFADVISRSDMSKEDKKFWLE